MVLRLAASILVIFVLLTGSVLAVSVPEEVKDVAEHLLEETIREIWAEIQRNPAGYNIPAGATLNDLELGQGFRVHAINWEEFYSYSGNNLSEITWATDYWRFPVTINGNYTTFIEIHYTSDSYEMAMFGGDASSLQESLRWLGLRTRQQPELLIAGGQQFLQVDTILGKQVLQVGNTRAGLHRDARIIEFINSWQDKGQPAESGMGGFRIARSSVVDLLLFPFPLLGGILGATVVVGLIVKGRNKLAAKG